MNAKWIRNLGLGALGTVAWLGGASAASAQDFNYGHHHSCSPYYGHSNYSYRPITTLPYYGSNYGVGGYGRYPSNYRGYSSNFGNFSNFGNYDNFRNYGNYGNYGGLNQFGGGYGMGGFPIGGSYGGGAFPRGGSYGGGAFPRGGSYGGGGFSFYNGR